MKKVILFLMFLMMVSPVLAMNDSITVKAQRGMEVKVYIWTTGIGPLLDLKKGFADENNTFETTFFSLNVPKYRLKVLIIDPTGTKVNEGEFDGMTLDDPILVDCFAGSCAVSVGEVSEPEPEFEVVIEEEVVESNESFIAEDVQSEDGESGLLMTGKAIFLDDDGSINLGYSVGSLAILACFIIFLFMMVHSGKNKSSGGLDEDDKELAYMEKKVKETEGKIKNIKDHDAKKAKLAEAKAKLAADEKELEDLQKEKVMVQEAEVQPEVQKPAETVVHGEKLVGVEK